MLILNVNIKLELMGILLNSNKQELNFVTYRQPYLEHFF